MVRITHAIKTPDTASDISNSPSGNISATTVQAAINELDSEKQPASANLDEYAAVNPTTAGLALLDDANASAQRTTLGLGTAAVKNTGTSGNTIPLLDAANTWSSGVDQVILGELGVGPNTGTPTERLSVGYGENTEISVGSATNMKTFLGSFNDGAILAINRKISTGGYTSASFPTSEIRLELASDDAQIRLNTSSTNGSGLATERLRVTGPGLVSIQSGCWGRGAPVTKTANFTVADTENNLINNKSGSACTVTLPTASSWTGREIWFKNTQAQQLNSASSNVVPLTGGAAGTAILTGTSGRWAVLVSDGTNWVIMAGVI